MLYRIATPQTIPIITGRDIAEHRTASERAFLGADVKCGRVSVTEPTFQQTARLVGVCAPYVAAAVLVASDQDARAAVLAGKCSLLSAARRINSESLTDHLRRASHEEWREAARSISPAVLWDEMLAPLLA